jgi:hypothetical protein
MFANAPPPIFEETITQSIAVIFPPLELKKVPCGAVLEATMHSLCVICAFIPDRTMPSLVTAFQTKTE